MLSTKRSTYQKDPAAHAGVNGNAPLDRILHSLNLDTIGGVESIFGSYLENAASATFKHHLMVLNRRCHPFFRPAVNQRISSLFYAKYLGLMHLPKMFRKCWASYSSSKLKPDIHIIYNTLDNPSAWAANHYAKTRIYYERGAAWIGSKESSTIVQNIRSTHHFFCNSNAAKRVLELRYGVDSKRCDVIYNPLRLDPEISSMNTTQDNNRFRIGVAGRLIPIKGTVIAFHALARLLKKNSGFELIIVGDGPEREKLKEIAHNLGLSSSIKFLGVLKDMDSFYASIDVLICPSLRESLGNVAIEGNARGCPVICSLVDGLAEAIVPEITGICIEPVLSKSEYLQLGVQGKDFPEQVYDPMSDSLMPPRAISPDHLAEAIWQLFQSPDKRAEMSRAAFKLSRERFNMEGYVKNLHTLIRMAQSSSPKL